MARRPVMDQELVIERAVRTADGQGGYTVEWETVTTLFANAREGGGGESSRDGERIEAVGRVTFEVYAVDIVGVLESDRVSWNGTPYNIDHLSPATRDVYRTMACTRGKAT